MKYGCIGEHLTHSFSKEIHNLLADYKYELKEISPDNLDTFLKNKDFELYVSHLSFCKLVFYTEV